MDASAGRAREREPRAPRDGLNILDDYRAYRELYVEAVPHGAEIVRMYNARDDQAATDDPIEQLLNVGNRPYARRTAEEKRKLIAAMTPDQKKRMIEKIANLIQMHEVLLEAALHRNERLAGFDLGTRSDQTYTMESVHDRLRLQTSELRQIHRNMTASGFTSVSRWWSGWSNQDFPNWWKVTKAKIYDRVGHFLKNTLIVGGLTAAGVAAAYTVGGGLYGLSTGAGFGSGAGAGISTFGSHISYPFRWAWGRIWGG